jgi:beta-glucosidase
LNAGNIKAEPNKVGDLNGMKITWTGGIGQVYSQSKVGSDKFDYLDADGALVFDAIVHTAPQDQVIMRIDCGYPCQGLVDFTDFYKKAPLEQKIVVKIPLSCFEKTGAKFGGINTPWLIYTTNVFALTVANVRYLPGAAKDADVSTKCGV